MNIILGITIPLQNTNRKKQTLRGLSTLGGLFFFDVVPVDYLHKAFKASSISPGVLIIFIKVPMVNSGQ